MINRAILGLSLALGIAATASAVTIDDSYLIGAVIPGSPSGNQIEIDRLVYFINLHNGTPIAAPDANTYIPLGPPVAPPLPIYNGINTPQSGGGVTSFNVDVTGYDYMEVKWANDSYYYYVGDLTGVNEVINDVVFNSNDKPQNASHYRLFGGDGDHNTPDGGLTAMLLGLGLTGLGATRRLIKK